MDNQNGLLSEWKSGRRKGRSKGPILQVILSELPIHPSCLPSLSQGEGLGIALRQREVGEDTLPRTTQAAVHLRPPLAILSSILRTKGLFSKLELERSCCHQCESPSRPIPIYCAGMLPRTLALLRGVSEAVPWLSKCIMFNFFSVGIFRPSFLSST